MQPRGSPKIQFQIQNNCDEVQGLTRRAGEIREKMDSDAETQFQIQKKCGKNASLDTRARQIGKAPFGLDTRGTDSDGKNKETAAKKPQISKPCPGDARMKGGLRPPRQRGRTPLAPAPFVHNFLHIQGHGV